MHTFLLSGNHAPLRAEDHPTIQEIADKLAGAGLRAVRLDNLEWAAIENALADHQGNRTHAAHSLGISVRTLQRKLKLARGLPAEGADDDVGDDRGFDAVSSAD